MKRFELNLEQLNGRMTITLFRDEEDKKPLFWSRSVAPSQWNEARKDLLVRGLKDITEKLSKD